MLTNPFSTSVFLYELRATVWPSEWQQDKSGVVGWLQYVTKNTFKLVSPKKVIEFHDL